MTADARKTLPMLVDEWTGCTKCSLSEHRKANNGMMVFGEGRQRGILFLGEGPGSYEESYGRPFIGKSGELLRSFIEHYKIKNYYITNVVACRACAPIMNPDTGLPKEFPGRNGRPDYVRYKDQPPTKVQIETCAPRVYEEIYMADPILIVALGATAATFLRGASVQVTKEHGKPMEVEIPGAGFRPVLSEKKKEWARKVKGQLVMPTERTTARYLMLPTLHPSAVLRDIHNEKKDNPFEQFARDLERAKLIYNRLLLELTGIVPDDYEEDGPATDVPYNLIEELQGGDD